MGALHWYFFYAKEQHVIFRIIHKLVGKKHNGNGCCNHKCGLRRHQCERQLPNFTKFATITRLPLPVIFPTWTKRLFDFQWRSHPDLLCSPVAVLCTNYNLENDCSRQFVKCKLGCQTENDSHYRWSVLRIVECIFCLREVYFREWWCWIVTFLWQLVLMAVNL